MARFIADMIKTEPPKAPDYPHQDPAHPAVVARELGCSSVVMESVPAAIFCA